VTSSPAVVRARALAATDALPPTFPIGTFVAANPLHGLEHHTFEDAAAVAAATSGARSFLTERDYRELYASGRIGADDLRRAVRRRGRGSLGVASLLDGDDPGNVERSVRTLSEQADHRLGGDLADRIDAVLATWCAAVLDEGQADWVLPHRELGLYGAWRRLAPRDPGLRRLVGRAGRRRVVDLPEQAAEALSVLVAAIGIPEHLVTDYFRASLRRLPGWAAALSRTGGHDAVVGFLAIRLALEHLARPELDLDPDQVRPPRGTGVPAAIERLAVWQEALELGYRDHLLAVLSDPPTNPGAAAGGPVEATVVVCIDVRSEGLRRHLEETGPYATVGFAGFFGLPVRVAALDGDPVPSCPVIVEPRATLIEVPDGDLRDAQRRQDRHGATEAAWDARHEAKTAPAAPFAFAEAAGWVLGPLAAINTLAPRAAHRLRRAVRRRAEPQIPTRMDVGPDVGGPATADPVGMLPDEQVLVAHGALTTMGMTSDFAPLVMFCGHRSATTNNPFAAALDCGACAGKAGGPNARALAELLNRPSVRAGLADSGIVVPETTWFVAAEHETTTDTVLVLDRHRVPESHRERLASLEADLVVAGERLAVERMGALPGGAAPGRIVSSTSAGSAGSARRRSADWAEPVPEWGLVRNAAVVVGPRSLTAGRDLQRRVFLHSHDPDSDPDGVALGTILTGPLVVGHWISSQYYFSTVDPDRHGAGTKPLHNVVAGIGVLEGPGGDLRVGLPLESVQFAGERVHEPMRLLAVVQAPRDRLDRLISRNAAVARLLDNGWVRLVAGSNGPDGWSERLRDGTWEQCGPGSDASAPSAGSMSGGSTGDAATEVQ
jgi:uncharacterized protein